MAARPRRATARSAIVGGVVLLVGVASYMAGRASRPDVATAPPSADPPRATHEPVGTAGSVPAAAAEEATPAPGRVIDSPAAPGAGAAEPEGRFRALMDRLIELAARRTRSTEDVAEVSAGIQEVAARLRVPDGADPERLPQDWGRSARPVLIAYGVTSIARHLEGQQDSSTAEMAGAIADALLPFAESDGDPYVRREAMKVFGILELPLDDPRWMRVRALAVDALRSGAHREVELGAIGALARLTLGDPEDPEAADAAAAFFRRRDSLGRGLAIMKGRLGVLGGMGRRSAVAREALRSLAQDNGEDGWIRERAIQAMERSLSRAHPEFVWDAVRDIVADVLAPDEVRRAALAIAGGIPPASRVLDLMERTLAGEPPGGFRDHLAARAAELKSRE